jgi:hypothetical protein
MKKEGIFMQFTNKIAIVTDGASMCRQILQAVLPCR